MNWLTTTKRIEPAAQAYPYPLLIKGLLLSAGRYSADNEIVYGGGRRYGYPLLLERIARLANALHNAGVKAGDTVAVLDWDSHRYLECFFAIPMLGAVLHTVNIRLAPDQIAYTMAHAEDDWLLVHTDFMPLLAGIAAQLPRVRGYIELTDAEGLSTEKLPDSWQRLGEYEQLLAAAGATYDFPDFAEESVATLFYTTGTTGSPKGVYFTHRQLVLHTLVGAGTLAAYQGLPMLRSDDVYMPITPMFHVHAWGVPYVATLMGVKQVYPGRYDPERLVGLIRAEGVTFSHCVPTLLQMILQSKAAEDADLSAWKVVIGGSALPAGLADAAARRGIDINSGYGMSETCPLVSTTFLTPRDQARPLPEQVVQRIRAGKPNALVEARILDSNGAPLPWDGHSLGELVLRAPWLTGGYLQDPDASEALWQGGWLHTGDVASIDADGVIDIRDRIKDVIKSGGEWVSSLEIENLISQQPEVAAAAVVGVADAHWGERPAALVVLRPGATLTGDAIRTHLRQFVDQGRLNPWAIPERIEIVTDLPKTSVGKVNKRQVRAQFAGHETEQ